MGIKYGALVLGRNKGRTREWIRSEKEYSHRCLNKQKYPCWPGLKAKSLNRFKHCSNITHSLWKYNTGTVRHIYKKNKSFNVLMTSQVESHRALLTVEWKLSWDRLFRGVSCQVFFKLNPTALVWRVVFSGVVRSGVVVVRLFVSLKGAKPRNVLCVSRTGPS